MMINENQCEAMFMNVNHKNHIQYVCKTIAQRCLKN